MPRRNRSITDELADFLETRRPPGADYFEKAVDATAADNRMLTGIYSLLAAGMVLLLLQVELSVWAGAALFAAWILFTLGFSHTAVHIHAHRKLLALVEAVANREEAIDLGSGKEPATLASVLRTEAVVRNLHTSDHHYLFLGLGCAGTAVVIDYWGYAWRGLLVLAGALVALVLVTYVTGKVLSSLKEEPEDDEDDEDDG